MQLFKIYYFLLLLHGGKFFQLDLEGSSTQNFGGFSHEFCSVVHGTSQPMVSVPLQYTVHRTEHIVPPTNIASVNIVISCNKVFISLIQH